MATGTPAPRYDFVCEPVPEPSKFRLLAETPLPTEHGDVTLYVYGDGNCSPWSVCVYGEVRGKSGVSMRLHDACLTSEVLGSVKCDCARQLRLAQRQLAGSSGVLVCSRTPTMLAHGRSASHGAHCTIAGVLASGGPRHWAGGQGSGICAAGAARAGTGAHT